MATSTGIFANQTIGFDEVEGSPSGSMPGGGGAYVITIKGDTSWSERDAFATFLMPVGTNVGGVWGAALTANPLFRVHSFQWEYKGGMQNADTVGLNTYRLCTWTITCHVPIGQNLQLTQPYTPPDPVPWLIHRWSVGGQYLTLPNRSIRLDPRSRVRSLDRALDHLAEALAATLCGDSFVCVQDQQRINHILDRDNRCRPTAVSGSRIRT